MSPEEFLREFGHLAETAGGAGQLRRLVPSLAATGRLSPTGTEFSERAGTELFEFVTSGSRGWAKYYANDGPIFLRIGNLDYQTIELDLESIQCVRPPAGAEGTRTRVQPGDILVSITGDTGMVGVVRTGLGEAYINQHVALARPVTGLLPDYIAWSLTSTAVLSTLQSYQRGIKNSLGLEDIRRLKFAVPPFPEQKRIVEKVDQLMALCDELEAKQKEKRAKAVSLNQSALSAVVHAPDKSKLKSAWSRVQDHFEVLYELPENVKELRQTILQLAVMGKLVRQDEGNGDVDGLLRQVAKAQDVAIASGHHKWAKSVQEVPSDLPKPRGWTWVRLANLLTFGPRNGFSPTGVEYTTKVKVLTLSATTRGVFQAEAYKYADIEVEDDSHLWLSPGDLLLQRANSLEYVGVAAIFSGPERQFIYPDLMMKLRIAPPLDLQFLHLCLGSAQAKEHFRSNASGTSGSMPKINQGVVNNLLVPIPPLREQLRIVEAVRRLMSFCDDLDGKLAQHRNQGQRLMQAVVEGLVA